MSSPIPGAPDPDRVRRSSADHAASYIRRLIIGGSLRPGDRVPQDEVASTLGISRIPIREALIALEREGWVTVELHRGAFVNTISADTVRDHYSLYGMVCGFAGCKALVRGGPDLADRLRKISEAIVRSSNEEEISWLSVEFHRAVLDEAHNPRITLIIRGLSVLVPGAFFVEVPRAIPIQKNGVAAISRAIRRRDPDAVVASYLEVMQAVGEKVVEVFEARGLFG